MSTVPSIFEGALPQLKATQDLENWTTAMKLYLRSQGLQHHALPVPDPTTTPSYDANEVKVIMILITRIDDALKARIKTAGWTLDRTAKQT